MTDRLFILGLFFSGLLSSHLCAALVFTGDAPKHREEVLTYTYEVQENVSRRVAVKRSGEVEIIDRKFAFNDPGSFSQTRFYLQVSQRTVAEFQLVVDQLFFANTLHSYPRRICTQTTRPSEPRELTLFRDGVPRRVLFDPGKCTSGEMIRFERAEDQRTAEILQNKVIRLIDLAQQSN